MSGTIKIQQYRSGIGRPVRQKKILETLGLGRMHRIVEKPDNDSIRGMVRSIPHLVRIVDDNGTDARQ
jgi:large subunit ribosomal protein L30